LAHRLIEAFLILGRSLPLALFAACQTHSASKQPLAPAGMASFYDEVEIEDMVFDEAKSAYFYPCPCGDKFVITLVTSLFFFSICTYVAINPYLTSLSQDDLMDGEEVARCPSCSLIIRVIYDPVLGSYSDPCTASAHVILFYLLLFFCFRTHLCRPARRTKLSSEKAKIDHKDIYWKVNSDFSVRS
jgi:diphthamide biosynthesis protein 3